LAGRQSSRGSVDTTAPPLPPTCPPNPTTSRGSVDTTAPPLPRTCPPDRRPTRSRTPRYFLASGPVQDHDHC
jgi:hypothetical protein